MERTDTEGEDLAGLLSDLVRIDSVNPDLVPGAQGEGRLAAFVAEWLRRRGLEVSLQDTGLAGRPNVVAFARGSGGGPSLMLNAHMDTVGVSGMHDPFQPEIRDGRLYGRGALDTKGALAAFMVATSSAARLALRGSVVLTAVADEEYASVGTESVVRSLKADAAIVGEPTALEIVTAHKGFAWFDIETRGVAAHGSLPDRGVDAIAKMGRVLTGIEELGKSLSRSAAHPMLGTGSVHASLIQGGQELSSYPASCRLSIERRRIPGESVEAVQQEIQDILDRCSREDMYFTATLHRGLAREPLEVARDSVIARTLAQQVRAVTGKEATFAGMGGWMDSALLAEAGIPAVILGPTGEGLHGETEWVDLESVRACSRIVLETIKAMCA